MAWYSNERWTTEEKMCVLYQQFPAPAVVGLEATGYARWFHRLVEERKPLYSSTFVADYLRPAAKKAGVHIEDGHRFGLHNLRHSLSNWLVNKAKVQPKTAQGILRHAKIQTTLDL